MKKGRKCWLKWFLITMCILIGTGMRTHKVSAAFQADSSAEAITEKDLEITEKGYETPEEAALAFIEALRDKNAEQMISVFALDTYIKNCNIPAWVERADYNIDFYISSALLPSGNNKFVKELNRRTRWDAIITDLRYLYQEFASGFGAGSTAVKEGESGQDVLNQFWLIQDEDDIFDIEVENNFEDIKALYEIANKNVIADYETLITKEVERERQYLGCDEIKQMAVHFKWKNIPFLLFVEAARYDDSWMLLKLGGNAFLGMGYTRQYAVPFCMFETEEEQYEFSENLANILIEIKSEKQDKNEEYQEENQEHRGYQSPEEAIEDFLDKMKQNNLEEMINALDSETLVQRIDIAKEIEYRNDYSWTIASMPPIHGSCIDVLNREFLNHVRWIHMLYLNLAADGINPEFTQYVSDPDKFINSIEKSDCSKLQYGEITEQYTENKNLMQYMNIEDVKDFSVELTLGERSERAIATCICYDGKWTVYVMHPEEED